jgi:hypothetical protein
MPYSHSKLGEKGEKGVHVELMKAMFRVYEP